ncbi:MAG: ABC transporter permease [Treponema sp.]|nr:ABC transporter permease [Treponema sp.]
MSKILKSKTGATGMLVVIVVTFCALFAPGLAPYEPGKISPSEMMSPPVIWQSGESPVHLLGTDNLGRDIFSRIIYGSQISILVGICSMLLSGVIGITLGLLSGYYGGIVDSVIMRLADSFHSIPRILLAMVILTVSGPGVLTLIFVIGVTSWVTYARLIRSETLSIKQKEFVKAARTIGTSNICIIFKHILPNVMPSCIVVSTLSVANSIIVEATLSFLGLGIPPSIVSWGGMLSDGRTYLATNWWIATFPGLAITITVLGIMFLGNWVRDLLDPHNQLVI